MIGSITSVPISMKTWVAGAAGIRDLSFRLQYEPGGAEQRVARHQSQAAHRREGGGPIEGAAGERAVLHFDALDQAAEYQSLAEGGKRRAGGKRERPMLLAADAEPAELECDAAKDQRQQHDDDGQIERRQNDRIGERESDHQSGAAEHEPGLVA